MSSNGIHSNRPTFSTFPLWGKLFSDVSSNPLSNTGEKIADAQKLLTQLRKSQIENIVTVDDQDEKQIITAQFDAEIKRVIETLQLGYRDYPLLDTKMVINDKGEPVHQLIRRPATNELAVPDFLNFTIHKSTFDSVKKEKLKIYNKINDNDQGFKLDSLFTDSDYAYACGEVIQDIFGFGISSKMPNGLNYYKHAYTLENNCGFICIGGQNDTIMVSINGLGCTIGKYGWEEDLHAWFKLFATRPKITRLDLAFDDFESDFASVNWAKEQHEIGGFKMGGRPPKFNIIGDYWSPDGSGSTAYIGTRTSSKMCRIYEKGKQLGQKDSPWTRVEVEYKAKDMHIPLDALLRPTQHFLAAYPCFHGFDYATKPCKFETIKKAADITWEKAISVTRHQFGKYLSAFRSFYEDDSLLLDILTEEKHQYPTRLKELYLNYLPSMPPASLPA